MELNGASSNRQAVVELASLEELLWTVLSRACPAEQLGPFPPVKRRLIRTTDTAEQVLRLKGEPMPVAAIHAACERLLGTEVSYESLRTSLSHGARPGGRFDRLGYGLYRLREPVSR
jgi:hypothetical protein